MPIMIAAMVFLTVLVLLIGIYQLVLRDKRNVITRLDQYVEHRVEKKTILRDENVREIASWRVAVRRLSRYVESPQWTRLMEHKLIQAGLPLRSSEFMVICLAVTFFAATLLFVASAGMWQMGMMGGLIGFLMPLISLRARIDRRIKKFNEQLGDTLVLAANSLRTGYSFMQSLDMVSREMPQPIAGEFGRVLQEMNLGISTEEALMNLAKRINSDDVDLVVTAVLIQRQVGGNLAEVLDNIAGTIRERVKLKGQIKTMTAQGRISGIVVGSLPIGVGIMIYLINPEYIRVLFVNPLGKMMLAVGFLGQVVGMIVIRKIVNIRL